MMVLQPIMMHSFLIESDPVLRMQPLILAYSRVHNFYWWFPFMWPFAFYLSANPNKHIQPEVQIFLLYYFIGLGKQIYWNNSWRFKLASGPSLSSPLPTPNPPTFKILLHCQCTTNRGGEAMYMVDCQTRLMSTLYYISFPLSLRACRQKSFLFILLNVGAIGFQSPFVFTANARNYFWANFSHIITWIFLTLCNQIKLSLIPVF